MKNLIILLVLSIYLAGCQPVQRQPDNQDLLKWKYGELRLLDPIDAAEPGNDLIALYTRFSDQSFQVRIDFLDLVTNAGQDIYILIDTNPGGLAKVLTNNNKGFAVDLNWDYLIKIPSSGNVVIIDNHFFPVYGMALLITRDISQDNIVISFNKRTLPISLSQTKIQVLITPSNQNTVTDKSEPFSIDSPSPARAKILFAFWNTFSSTTPAQTLRSWAGAHTGPMSSRHGLKYLIDAAAQTKSPVFLLDLLTPDTLSALDYLNALPRIRILTDQGILGLADIAYFIKTGAPGEIINSLSIDNRANGLDFKRIWNISSNMDNKVLYSNLDLFLLMNDINLYKIRNGNVGYYDYAHYKNNINCALLPHTAQFMNQSPEFSLKCKGLLLTSALLHPASPLILGGDFSNSILGTPALSLDVFTYISAHPWIQILSINDLVAMRDLQSNISPPYYENQPVISESTQQTSSKSASNPDIVQSEVYGTLLQSPENQLTDLAWQIYLSLTQSASSDLLSLRSNYLGQIGQIIAAAQWAQQPTQIEGCEIDLDYDGAKECILANNNIFVIIEPDGGYIPFMFSTDARGIHQIIGPTWEFIAGLSDPSSWEPSLGIRADSEQILGAFSDPYNRWNKYNVELNVGNVILENGLMSIRKSVSISAQSVHLDIQNLTKSSNSSSIPLVIDPWFRFTSGWGDHYVGIKSPSVFQWGITSGEKVEIHSTNQIRGFAFNDTRASLAYPEDPNFDYSRGHYLPYPMAIAEISPTENYSVDIIINP